MATITREKVQKINEGCFNGFTLDIQYYVFHGEYMLIKYDYNKNIVSRLWFRKGNNNKTIIQLNTNHFTEEHDMLVESGLGKTLNISDFEGRKSIKLLQKASFEITEQLIDYTLNIGGKNAWD